MFDVATPKKMSILSGSMDKKTCMVRYPSDEEWCDRIRRQKMVRQNVGRGKTRPIPQRPEIIDAALFGKIRLDLDGPTFDEAEAADVIDRVDRAEVVEVVGEPEGFTVKLLAMKRFETSHLVRVPFKGELLKHERSSFSRLDGGRTQEIRVAMEPSGALYDAIALRSSGYIGAVPINHKYAVVFEIIQEIERDEDDDDPEQSSPATGPNSRASGS